MKARLVATALLCALLASCTFPIPNSQPSTPVVLIPDPPTQDSTPTTDPVIVALTERAGAATVETIPTGTPSDPSLPNTRASETHLPPTDTETAQPASSATKAIVIRTATKTNTSAALIASATNTNTAIGFTATPTRTFTATLPGDTATPSPTPTRTFTPTPTATGPTAAPTRTFTATHTNTNAPATPTFTPTHTFTNTTVPPTATFTRTSAPPTPTFTFTSPPPTATFTFTPVPPSNTPSGCQPQGNGGFESEVVALINQERANNGLGPLSQQSQLTAAAQAHSTDMACNHFFSHTGSNGSSPFDRMAQQGYSFSAAAENIAAGYGTPADVVAGWMNSAGHRANILGPYTQIGVGYIYEPNSDWGTYWTTTFGAP